VPAPPARVWAAMTDCTRALKFLRGLVGCRIIERDPAGAWDVREHVVSWISLLPNVRSVFRSEYVVNRSIAFRRVSGDIDVMEGVWQLEPLRNGAATRLRYTARVGKDTYVPASIIRSAIESDVPKTLRSLRDEVLRGP
jgi:ribosome-associated toxin RatA of RatAB toxin-antitoxin module